MTAEMIGRRLATRRQELGLHQQDVADLAGFARQYLARMEGGHGPQYIERLDVVLDVLGLEMVIRPRTVGLARDSPAGYS